MKCRPFPMLLLCLSIASLGACGGGTDPGRDAAAAQARAGADKAIATYRSVRAGGNDAAALMLGEDLLKRWPEQAEVRALEPEIIALRQSVAAGAESARLAGLWIYHRRGKDGDTAFIYRDGDSAEQANAGVTAGMRLVLRDHPDWGRDIFLLVQNGRFDCRPDCQVELIVDGGAPERIAAFASEPDQNPALFFTDTEAFLARVESAKTLEVAAPMLKDAGARARFQVSGFVRANWLGASAEP